jgi:zinc protease
MSQEIAGKFNITVTVRPGTELAQVEKIVDEELARLKAEPPSADEVARAVAQRESHFLSALEPISEFGGRADRLNMYNVFTGDPGYLAKDFERLLKVEPAGVQRVAKQYLGEKRVALEVVPGPQTTIADDPREPAARAREALAKEFRETAVPELPVPAEDADRQSLPKPGAEPSLHLPPVRRGRLSCGAEVLVSENHKLPSLHLRVVFPFGRADDPAGRPGLASLVAATWDEGTAKRSSEQIAEELAGLGARLSLSADWDHTALRLYTPKRSLTKALEVAGDVMRQPSFPTEELDRQRNIALSTLVQVRNEPLALAGLAAIQTIYGYDHPYGRPTHGTEAALKAVVGDDLRRFYAAHARPEQATVIVVGDVTYDEVVQELEKVLGGWKATGTAPTAATPKAAPVPTRITLVDKPGAVQSVITVGMAGFDRKSPDYFSLVVMNTAFGGQFASRLNMNLREDKGYTYGARSMFDWRTRQPGLFLASSSVQTAVTVPALKEFFAELQGIAGKRPVVGEELEFCKKYVTRGFPMSFETTGGLSGQLQTLVEFGLPDDYYNRFVPAVAAVEAEALRAAARRNLDLDHLTVIVVGDRTKIESDLRGLPEGKSLRVVRFDDDFRLAPLKGSP